MKGRHTNVSLSFLPVGHTKFKPDGRFGNFKTEWRKSKASGLADVIRIAAKVKDTTVVLVGDESGSTFIDFNEWTGFFAAEKFQTVPNITKFQHFETNVNNIGTMQYRENVNASWKSTNMIPDDGAMDGFPEILTAKGLIEKRKKYLYKKIRRYVPQNNKDVLCPSPFF